MGISAELKKVFFMGRRGYSVQGAWQGWLTMCARWEKRYGFFRHLRGNPDYKAYLKFSAEIKPPSYHELARKPLPEGEARVKI